MNTNTMELNMNEMEMINGGDFGMLMIHIGSLASVGAGTGALIGAFTGGPVGTVVGAAIGGVVGGVSGAVVYALDDKSH